MHITHKADRGFIGGDLGVKAILSALLYQYMQDRM